jgi:predicted DCC family thiol-disulfide oxidoreductase YuxK
MNLEGKKLVLFDGVCNVCNRFVNFVIDRDPDEQFVFAPLSSELGRRITREHGLDVPGFDSMVLLENGRAYCHSSAILRVLARLPGAWFLCWGGLLVPPFARDAGYRWFASHRYAWFGKSDQCRVPTPDLRSRFAT